MPKKQALDPALAAILAGAQVNLEEETELEDTPEEIKFRGEGVLYHLEYPLSPRVTRVCKWEKCGSVFTTDYAWMGYCSNECRVSALKEHFGIAWTPGNRPSKEKWEVRIPPHVIPMQALRAMKAIVNQAELDLGHPIEIGVDQKPFSVALPYFPKNEKASLSDYKLPGLSEPSSASSQSSASHSAESVPQTLPSDKIEKSAQSQEQEQSSDYDDLLGSLFSGL